MKSTSLVTKIIRWLLHAMQLQLFLTLFSLPFLCAWGIPLSLLSPIGNILFGPILTLFLLISSLIFFTELVGIPNSILITCLEQITHSWLYVMHADSKQWLIGFIQPSYYVLALLPLGALFIMLCNQTRSLYRSIICLSLLLGLFWTYVWYIQQRQPRHISIPCNKGTLHLIQHKKTVTLIDPGYLGKSRGSSSWVHYTLAPLIIQQTGCTTLDHLILLQPSTMTFKAVESLITKIPITHLYIPLWHGASSWAGLPAYNELKKRCSQTNTTLTDIGHDTHRITLDAYRTLTITPLPHIIRTNSVAYPAFSIHTFIDNQPVTLYSAKYSKDRD